MIETLEDLVERLAKFIEVNGGARKNKIFSGWKHEEICDNLRISLLDRCLIYVTNEVGDIVGICNCHRDIENKFLYVCEILTTKEGLLPIFILKFCEFWPDYKLVGHRYGEYKKYDTKRFIKKALKLNNQQKN